MLAHFARSGSESHPPPSKNPRSANGVELNGEDLSCYSNKMESVSLRKCLYDQWHTNKAYVSGTQWQTCLRVFMYKMAAKINWHRYGTKLRQCHPMYTISGGSYWAGWAAARPLFRPCGPQVSLARPLSSPDKHNILHYCSLHSHSDVLTSIGVDGPYSWLARQHRCTIFFACSARDLLPRAFKVVTGPWCCLTKLTVCLARPLFISFCCLWLILNLMQFKLFQ